MPTADFSTTNLPPVAALELSRMKALPMTLRPSLRKMALLFFGSGVFVSGGLWLFPTQPFFGAILLMVFGLGFVVGAAGLIPNSTYLTLSADGFTFASFFRKHTVLWESVEIFHPIKLGVNRMVGWKYAAAYKGLGRYANPDLVIAGAEAALPDSYGMSVEGLCELMNEIKRHHGNTLH